MTQIEHAFPLFTDAEIQTGLQYAAEKDRISLDYVRLRTLANNAGKTRVNAQDRLTPREAVSRAIKAFNREYPGSQIRDRAFEGYVHAIAKMMSGRSPNTKAKREKDQQVEEILALGHKIDETPPMDPSINEELALAINAKKADVS